jgi:hypothetical protein
VNGDNSPTLFAPSFYGGLPKYGSWALWPVPLINTFAEREADSESYAGTEINKRNWWGLYSFHNGVNAAMCDGAVRFLSEETHMRVVHALITREGGELVAGGN